MWFLSGVVICLKRGADCLHVVQLMPLHPQTPSSLASLKSRLVIPFWYQLTQVVLEKKLLNGCSCSVVVAALNDCQYLFICALLFLMTGIPFMPLIPKVLFWN